MRPTQPSHMTRVTPGPPVTHRGQPSERAGALQSGWSASTAHTAAHGRTERDAYGTPTGRQVAAEPSERRRCMQPAWLCRSASRRMRWASLAESSCLSEGHLRARGVELHEPCCTIMKTWNMMAVALT